MTPADVDTIDREKVANVISILTELPELPIPSTDEALAAYRASLWRDLRPVVVAVPLLPKQALELAKELIEPAVQSIKTEQWGPTTRRHTTFWRPH
jgi:hypothetical protein